MHLKSLTLKGFKSFAQPTTFVFEPGVTCIVGPNGSGKSNVVDALAWVMGEQGAKTLRGGKMEDVIFAGTSTRGPLGRAEVQLTIDNADGALPIEYAEVTISRTLFRNGSSEYAINGEGCRLLDVQELLSDSGLGREMHVIVGQGRLDTVLQASPEDRRGFIEEAAGILKHRRRKEKTLRKLDAMEANLTRLSDLAGEIRRQLKPLGRQAEIAREAQTIAAVVRDAKARLFADDVVALRTALADHTRTEQERHTERLVLSDQAETVRAGIARLEKNQNSIAVDEARSVAFGLEQVQERVRGLYTLANQRLALLGSEEDDAAVTAVTVSQATIDEAKEDIETISSGLGDAQDAAAAASREVVNARAELDTLDVDIAEQSALVSEYDMRLSSLRGNADAAASALAAVRGAVLRQENALEAAHARRREAEEALEAIDDAEAPEGTAVEYAAAYESAQRAATAAEAERESLRERLHAAEREVDALTAKAAALSSALSLSGGAAEIVAEGGPGVRGLVGDAVQVRAGYEAAIAAVLGPLAEGVLVGSAEDAFILAAEAAERRRGVVDFVVADAPREQPTPPAVDGVIAATETVTAPDGILGILAHVLIADDLDAARAARRVLDARGDTSTTIVTTGGDVITAQTLRTGSGGERSRLELAAERDTATERLTEIQVVVDSLREARIDADEAVEETRRQAKDALRALREHDAALATHAEQLNKVTVRHEAAVAECDRLETGLAQAQAAVADAEAKAEAAKAELDAAVAAPRPVLDASARDGLLEALESAREGEVRARLEVETLRERVRAAQSRVTALERQREQERDAAAEAARRAVIRRAQREAASGVVDELPRILDSLDRSVTEARVALAEAEAARSAQNEELVALRAQESSLRERLAGLTESVHGLELQIHEKKLHLNSLLERVSSELALDEDVLVAEYGPDQLVPRDPGAEPADGELLDDTAIPFDRRIQQRRLADAERKLAQLGRVNPLALEEFAALEQRHAFLTTQLTDLTQTRQDLLTIIADLDERMQTIFASAFEDTKEAFGQVFPLLFPGGTGSISLTDPDNMLTTGIEVSVRPVGKKIERLSLLSGGERSLAAVALLVAIFKARPSPFYILDEVEAALDDANLGRLLTVFEQLRESSQLLVITHQKRTMEIADALYGVSMRQDGVSAVVGQRVGDRAAAAV
ncbi:MULTISPECIES: chromosome segregation protein SMC [unclassified Microbacterium]|uniref:chromosome segregation protein SMC n=1 Tax=unclassified Microbacterium TaxID=2609290 RepID=UPI0021A83FC1|nr:MULTISPECIES: chromosome segregation protein SMC [unclassified Microbacterium]MCT1363414.1 chromosome segregation protein SMC [Microbacterium sp. p3-SID131]MCT1376317.1 chromosome segregation protein SMC [Microbacterium sp. p3-SID337]MDH5133560.1 chromosome segregation protein SMC [Microbacterium sp. RD10]MDH5138098.1 chromosome segregation protein SMC [Microbacterium sp. RD11]MDH5145983.1 chromosome segregation protein SMC [Microbacterium sp. RD12]